MKISLYQFLEKSTYREDKFSVRVKKITLKIIEKKYLCLRKVTVLTENDFKCQLPIVKVGYPRVHYSFS